MFTVDDLVEEYRDLSLNKVYGPTAIRAIWSTSYEFARNILPASFRESNPDAMRSMTLWLFIVWVTDSIMDNYVSQITPDDFARVSELYMLNFLSPPPTTFADYLKTLQGNYRHAIPHQMGDAHGVYTSPDSPPPAQGRHLTQPSTLLSHNITTPHGDCADDEMSPEMGLASTTTATPTATATTTTHSESFIRNLMDALFEGIERVYLCDYFTVSMQFINRNLVAWQSLAYWSLLFLRATYEGWSDEQFSGETHFRQYRLHTGGMMCIFSHLALFYNINILEQSQETIALWTDAAILVAYLNDIASLPRDIRTKTPNLIRVIALEQGCDYYTALQHAIKLTTEMNTSVRQAFTSDPPSQHVVEGSYHWEQAEPRYSTGLILAEQCRNHNRAQFDALFEQFVSPSTEFDGEPTG